MRGIIESTEPTENNISNDGADVTPSLADHEELIPAASKRLPVELWDIILSLNDDMPIDFEQRFVCVPPFVLRSVCCLWKNIVDRNPSLWTSVNLTCDAKNNTTGLQEAFDVVLRNSAMRPLSIYAKHGEITFDANSTAVFPLFEKASHQTKFLQISGPHGVLKMAAACWRTSQSTFDIPLSNFDIEIELVNEVRLDLDDVMEPFVRGYPLSTMRNLTLTVSCTNGTQVPAQDCEVFWAAASELDWSALTTLKLATEEMNSESTVEWNLTFCFLSKLLPFAPNLQHFRIEGDMILESSQSVTLGSLRTLYVHGVVHGEDLFPFLVCPALEELDLGGCCSRASMLDFVAQCTPTLTCLSIDFPLTTSVQDLIGYHTIGFLAHKLTALTLSVWWTVQMTTDTSFHFLSLSPSFFPALDHLHFDITLRGNGIDQFPWYQIDNFLPDTVARLLPGSKVPLRTFRLVFNMSFDRVLKEEHNVWWEGGMKSAVIRLLRTMKHHGQLEQDVSVYALTGHYGEQTLNLI
ncbi:hypothetical protein CYLTODRAFT_451777 [Cylindrobasidium torrendii FP15055 ss-10]|uniref:F-box domain-containing protein n=1 Tax=Cylindrobasidium torrendii FP15055 ss-10 TaxID=1314674 RepID=A0A0D7BJQ4_9AGAR|nr:hypothetical protein CYLTODRAFT_451777 [Cylindrobasidium torrendii FP15055 ss-10]